MAWEREDTERWLDDYPLPADFVHNGEVVYPRYQLRTGYGQWLRTAGSYHPALRGLFALVHEVLAEKSATGARMPTPEELGTELAAIVTMQGTLGLDPEPAAPAAAAQPAVGQGVDFARRLKANQPPTV